MTGVMSSRERELFAEYVQRGYDVPHARSMAKKRYMGEVIRGLKVSDPAKYAELMQRVENEKLECSFEVDRREALERLRRRALTAADRAKVAVVSTVLPVPSLDPSDYIAFREWTVNETGCLYGAGYGSHYRWKAFNVASAVPRLSNEVGLYAVRIDAQSMVTGGIGCHFNGKAAGLVALSGDVIEHDDGVLRAECARILCIWYIPGNTVEAYNDVPMLMVVYPTTPLYVTTKQLAAEALFRVAVALMGLRYHENDFVQDFGMRGQF
jgi:hypothetical protein